MNLLYQFIVRAAWYGGVLDGELIALLPTFAFLWVCMALPQGGCGEAGPGEQGARRPTLTAKCQWWPLQ